MPWSHPLRMRGLKLMVPLLLFRMSVASFTDAWIETREVNKVLEN